MFHWTPNDAARAPLGDLSGWPASYSLHGRFVGANRVIVDNIDNRIFSCNSMD